MARLSEAQNARNVLILSGVGHFSTHFFELIFPTLAVTLAGRTRLPLDLVLGWSFLGYLVFGLAAVPAALLADRVSSRLLLITALFGLGVASLAASEAPNGRVLSLCLAAMGGCASILHPAGMSLTGRISAARDRATAVDRVFGNVAIALTPLVTATLCAHLGWQPTFRAVGYAICAVAVACGFLRVDEPRAAPVRDPRVPAPGRDALLPVAVLLGAAGLAGIGYRGTTLVLPGYFAGRVSEIGFGAAASLAYACGIVGQYAGRRLADRYDPRRLYLAFHAVSVPALVLMAALSGFPVLGAAALFAFVTLGMRPIEDRLLAQYAPPRWHAVASAGKVALSFGVGSLAVWLVAWAGAAGGLSYALLWLAGVVTAVVAAAAWLVWLAERRPEHLAADAVAERRSVAAVFGSRSAPGTAATERRPPEQAGVP